VLSPESGLPFTDSGAWHFIADLLEAGHEVSEIEMKKPKGKVGYVLKTAGYTGCPKIYIKLTLSANMVNGRSFHNDEWSQ
jgi:hypothetical protein